MRKYYFFFLIFGYVETIAQKGEQIQIVKEYPATSKLSLILGGRNVEVNTWNEHKIRLDIKIEKTTESVKSAEEELSLAGFSTTLLGDELRVRSGSPMSFDSFDVYTLGLPLVPGKKFISREKDQLFYYDGNRMIPLQEALKLQGKKTDLFWLFTRLSITIWLPKTTQIQLQNDFSFINIKDPLRTFTIKGNNIELITGDIDTLHASLSYSSLNGKNIKESQLNLSGTELFIDSVYKIDIVSAGSNVEIKKANIVSMQSVTDEMRIGEAGIIAGEKKYGKLIIDRLTNRTDITGENANIRFNELMHSTTNIKIKNNFAQLYIPVKGLSGYIIEVKGKMVYTSGNVQFQQSRPPEPGKMITLRSDLGDKTSKIVLECDQCTIKF